MLEIESAVLIIKWLLSKSNRVNIYFDLIEN